MTGERRLAVFRVKSGYVGWIGDVEVGRQARYVTKGARVVLAAMLLLLATILNWQGKAGFDRWGTRSTGRFTAILNGLVVVVYWWRLGQSLVHNGCNEFC